jgi:predicted amidohydrolase YtcJ
MKEAGKRGRETILTGGVVITMEDPVEARELDIAISDGIIASVGTQEEIDDLKETDTEIIDVRGQTIMPGLIDSHNHMTLFGHNLEALNLSPSRISSIEELIKILKKRAAEVKPGEWIKAWGLDETRLAEKRYPTKAELDEACPQNPVRIIRTCMHVMLINSFAMKLVGIAEDCPNPDGGELVRDEQGNLTGILFELGAMNLIDKAIPHATLESCADALKRASDVYVSEGITMACEAGAGWTGNPNEAAGFQKAWQRGQLTPRVSMGLMENTYNLFPQEKGTGLFTGLGNDELWIGPIKFVADGGIGAKTAYMSKPYERSDYCGVLAENPESLKKRMEVAHKAGFQISIHAIGDKTIEIVLDIYEDILARYPRKDHRHRIEHVALPRPDLLDRISRLNIIAVVQPGFIYYLGDSWIDNIGPERLKNTIAIKTMLEKGITVAASSDRPVTDGNPWYIIWAAVTRRTITGNTISPKECISIQDALKLYTVNGAYTHFAEEHLGTLTPGKYADMVILDENPLVIDPMKLKDIKVKKTFIGGNKVFDAGS